MRSLGSPNSLVILVGYVFGALALASALPAEIPPSWRLPGGGTIALGGPMVAFLLPTAVLVTDVLLRSLCVKHPIAGQSTTDVLAVYDAIMLRFSAFVVAVHGAVLLALSGVLWGREWTARLVPVMLGLTLISIGNLLPRTRPNRAIGVRTHQTLSNRALWIRTHRAAGYIVVACGAVLVLSAIALPSPIGPAMILVAGPAALAATWLAVLSSRKHPQA